MGVLPLVDGKVVYREKVSTLDLPKEEVFRRARRWWVNNYRSAKDVFQLVDKETGEIIGKGYGTIFVGQPGRPMLLGGYMDVYHVISVDVAEDDYIVTVYGLKVEHIVGATKSSIAQEIPVERYNWGTVKSVTTTFIEIDRQTQLTLKSLHQYIKHPSI